MTNTTTEEAVQNLIRNHEYRVAKAEMQRDKEAREQLFVQLKDRDGNEIRGIVNAEHFRNNAHRDGNRGLILDGKRVLSFDIAPPSRQPPTLEYQQLQEEMIRSASVKEVINNNNREPAAHIRLHQHYSTISV